MVQIYLSLSLTYIFSKFLAQDNDFPAFWLVPQAHDMSHYR